MDDIIESVKAKPEPKQLVPPSLHYGDATFMKISGQWGASAAEGQTFEREVQVPVESHGAGHDHEKLENIIWMSWEKGFDVYGRTKCSVLPPHMPPRDLPWPRDQVCCRRSGTLRARLRTAARHGYSGMRDLLVTPELNPC
jgi:hypothetical protein